MAKILREDRWSEGPWYYAVRWWLAPDEPGHVVYVGPSIEDARDIAALVGGACWGA